VVPGLFQEVEKVLSGNVFQKKKQEGRSFKGPVKGYNVGMEGQ
jgi:hypothetical protein